MAQPTKNDPPKKVQVGPFNLDVQFVDNVAEKITETDEPAVAGAPIFGALVLKDQAIYLSDKQKGDTLADTLLHEVMHAVWAVVGGWAYTEADEERIVSMLTGTLLDTFRRNKELTKFLFDND